VVLGLLVGTGLNAKRKMYQIETQNAMYSKGMITLKRQWASFSFSVVASIINFFLFEISG